MRIRMLETAKGSPDGVSVYEYAEGVEYEAVPHTEMSDELAGVFIAQGLAVEVVEAAEPVVEEKPKAARSRKSQEG